GLDEQIVGHREAAHQHGRVRALIARERRRHLVTPLLDVLGRQAEALALLRLEPGQLGLDGLERELVETAAITRVDRAHGYSPGSVSVVGLRTARAQRMTASAGERLAEGLSFGGATSSRPAFSRSAASCASSAASRRPARAS